MCETFMATTNNKKLDIIPYINLGNNVGNTIHTYRINRQSVLTLQYIYRMIMVVAQPINLDYRKAVLTFFKYVINVNIFVVISSSPMLTIYTTIITTDVSVSPCAPQNGPNISTLFDIPFSFMVNSIQEPTSRF